VQRYLPARRPQRYQRSRIEPRPIPTAGAAGAVAWLIRGWAGLEAGVTGAARSRAALPEDRAAGWLCLSETTDRGRNGRHHRRTQRQPERLVFLKPLRTSSAHTYPLVAYPDSLRPSHRIQPAQSLRTLENSSRSRPKGVDLEPIQKPDGGQHTEGDGAWAREREIATPDDG
jgi:hypothetical protein